MSDGQDSQPSTTVPWSQPCRQFEFQEIQLATDNFNESREIGRGGFGKVYKATIFNGSNPVDVAIKRLDSKSHQGAAEFSAEIEMLSKLRHSHLVSLFGYCNHGKEMVLLYEYIPNGTLEDHLHKLRTPLSWLQRLNICIGAACGLHYLHTGTGIEYGVIHRDVKSSNILLNEIWAAKISDFGLSRTAQTNQTTTGVDTLVKGTFGYLDPNYFTTGRLTRKSDVYSFGVVLLEVLCRKKAVDRSLDEQPWGLVTWAQDSIKEGNLKHIIDFDIRGEIYPKCLKEYVRIVERCLVSNPKNRSTMAEVVVGLESVLNLQVKVNSSMHHSGRTIFGRMADKFSFSSKGENSAQSHSKTSSKDNRKPILKAFKFPGFYDYMHDNLSRALSNVSEDLMRITYSSAMTHLGRFEDYHTSFTPMHDVKRFFKGRIKEWVNLRELYDEYKWLETRGVDEESSEQKDLRRDIKWRLCLSLLKRVPMFENMDERLLDAICERLKLCSYTENTYIIHEGEFLDKMLFIIHGSLEGVTKNGGTSGTFLNAILLKEGDICGEEVLTWALDPKSSYNLPSSTRTVRVLTDVEGFVLPAEELKFAASQFRRLHGGEVQHIRYYSQQWRRWAACVIQASWRIYFKRKMSKITIPQINRWN